MCLNGVSRQAPPLEVGSHGYQHARRQDRFCNLERLVAGIFLLSVFPSALTGLPRAAVLCWFVFSFASCIRTSSWSLQ